MTNDETPNGNGTAPRRLTRILRLVGLLQTEEPLDADRLAAECNVSRRTIFRDLNTLRDAGIGVSFDDTTGGYALSGNAYVPATEFTLQEVLSLLVVCRRAASRESGVPFQQPAYRAALKLVSNLPPLLREYVEEVEDTIDADLGPRNPLDGSQSVYDRLVDSVHRRRRVRIVYGSLSPGEGRIETSLATYRLHFQRRSWYAIGHSSEHDAVRTFNLGRIRELTFDDETYDVPADFSLEKHFGNAWNLIARPDETHEVVVRFQPLVAQNVAEVRWHRTQKLEWNADGTLDFHVTVDGLDEIQWWILGYGDQAEVVRPPELRQMVADRVRGMLGRYE